MAHHQLVNNFDVRFENEFNVVDNVYNWMRLAEHINRYTPPRDPEAYFRENYFNENNGDDDHDGSDLPPPLIPLRNISPSYSPTPPAYCYFNENNGDDDYDEDDRPPPLIPLRNISPSYSPTPPAYCSVDTDSEDMDSIIVIADEEDILETVDLVSDDEEEQSTEEEDIRPTVICWAGRQ